MPSKRTLQLERVAFDLELEFSPEDEWSVFTFLKDFHLFRRGHSRKITNIMRKRDDWLRMDARIFDYRYRISTGKTTRTFKQTVFFMHSKELALPEFLMKPETFFHKIGQWIGLQKDIDFEAFPDFSNQYLLQGEDEDYIRALMKDNILRYFTIEKNWCLEGVNYYLIVYRNNVLLSPAQIRSFYKKGMSIFKLLSQNTSL